MSCDLEERESLGEGARKGSQARRLCCWPPPSNLLPQPHIGMVGRASVPASAVGGHGGPPHRLHLSGRGIGKRADIGGENPPLRPSPSPHSPLTALGLDFGSRYVKLVYRKEKGGWGRKKLDTLTFFRDYLQKQGGRLAVDWERLGLAPPKALVATGYGKNLLKEHFPTITEIRAHFLGARHATGLDHFILLEAGGQDTKVLYVKDGRVFDFLTNDRCAAGTGRYLENMARFLKMPLNEFAGAWQEPVDISHTCAIFGESELIGYLLEGAPPERIAAGVNASVARRVLMMVRRYPCHTLVFAGGVARNQAVVRLLRQQQDYQVVVPPYPQFTGALGCCLEACKHLPEEAP